MKSHLKILMKLVSLTDGAILEIGMGHGSTPALHDICGKTKRKLVSYDNNLGWYRRFKRFETDYHSIRHTYYWNKIEACGHWSIVFIDSSPVKRRRILAVEFAYSANFVVLHDSEPEKNWVYKYSRMYHQFRYRYDFTEVIPHTTILSNFVDVKKLLT